LAVAGVKVIGNEDKVEKPYKALIYKGKRQFFIQKRRYKSVEKYELFNPLFSTFWLLLFPQNPVWLISDSGKLKFPKFLKIVKPLDL